MHVYGRRHLAVATVKFAALAALINVSGLLSEK